MIRKAPGIREILPDNQLTYRAKEHIEKDYNCSIRNIEIFDLKEVEMRAMKKRYFNKEENTDIITLEYKDKKAVEIEIYLNLERIEENAKKYKQELKEELLRVIIHAFLHVAGEKDSDKREKQKMKAAEDYYLEIVSRETKH
jgi:probable rRNA maturation factor